MKHFTLLSLFVLVSCGSSRYIYSSQISRFNQEHISKAIYELGPNYTKRTDPIVGKVYTWRNTTYFNGSIDSSGNFTPPIHSERFIHLYTTQSDTVTDGIYSIR